MDAKFLHFLHLISSIFLSSAASTPQDSHLIKCGSTKNYVVVDYRYFVGDSSQKSSPYYLPQQGKSIALNNPNPPSNSSALHTSARIFTSASTYAFQINNPGTHFLRLHFYPFSYGNYNLSNADFSVVANGFSLFSHFGPDLAGVNEFLLMVDKLEQLEITFTPTRSSNFAFVNAIEVFLAPKNLFFGDGGVPLISPGEIQVLKQNISSHLLETLYRVNVGGSKLTPANDTLWRTWVSDEDFLVLESASKRANTTDPPNYRAGGATRDHAPDIVYMTARQMNVANGSWSLFNITWHFPVPLYGKDVHFIRLHFCDIVSLSLDTLYFNVYINEITAYENVDLSLLAFHHLASPCYLDFLVKNTKHMGSVRISIGPSDLSTLRKNAILNGVEIMRVVDSQMRSKKKSISILVVLVVGGFLALSLFLAILALSKRKWKRTSATISGWASLRSSFASPGPNGYYDLKIPFADIQLATNDFDENLIIGSSSYGTVYKGVLKDNTKVAVKRGTILQEFQTEITVLSRIRHCHLVSLIGFCEEQSETILVYEYMEKGPLRNHLIGSSNFPPLSWKQRLEICISAARGLHYLHTGSSQVIVHCDIKSTNILLDENYLAKVSGFGHSRPGPCEEETHKGSFGTSDVYAFGVVLVEVLCGRHDVVDEEESELVERVMEWRKKGMLERIVDRRIVAEVKTGSLEKFVETAEKCLGECGGDRLSMGDVLWNLERAYRIQMDQT